MNAMLHQLLENLSQVLEGYIWPEGPNFLNLVAL